MATLSNESIKSSGEMVQSESEVWVNADRTKAVEAGSPDAAFLLVGKGGQLSREDAEKFGVKAKDIDPDAPHVDNTATQPTPAETAESPDVDGDGRAEGGPEGEKKALSAPARKTATKTAAKKPGRKPKA